MLLVALVAAEVNPTVPAAVGAQSGFDCVQGILLEPPPPARPNPVTYPVHAESEPVAQLRSVERSEKTLSFGEGPLCSSRYGLLRGAE